ncbi:MAG: protease complex subunit PrcB family protein [Gemmatimonadaceae bacterium]|nr:protease complex subunit PrcB family protein [Gemmatimonadaceae bacterium]
MRPVLLLSAAAATLATAACSPSTSPSFSQPEVIELLAAAPFSLGAEREQEFRAAFGNPWNTGYCCRGLRVARTEAEWSAIWDTIVAPLSPPPTPPAVDFASEMVVVALNGSTPNGGYSIEIRHVARLRDTTFVVTAAVRPGRNCVVSQVVTADVDGLVVPRAPPPAILVMYDEVRRC